MNSDVLGSRLPGRYDVERELGAGGMATVYLAHDLKHHRQVAIKVLHAEISALVGPERFLKEIELTASLQHPHILPLFAAGSSAKSSCPSATRCGSRPKSRMRCSTPTAAALCTATSNPRMSCCRMATRSWPT